jgi:hypothetical protein
MSRCEGENADVGNEPLKGRIDHTKHPFSGLVSIGAILSTETFFSGTICYVDNTRTLQSIQALGDPWILVRLE